MTKTTHDRTVERLPWLVNGTLGADERREVEEHLAACADCRRELAATRGAFDLATAHLPPQVLTAYVEAPDVDRWVVDGAPVERSLVGSHLGHCDDCREELEMLRQGLAALGDDERGEAAGAGVAGLGPAGSEPTATVRPFRRPAAPSAPPPVAAPRWHWVALAACLLIALVTAGGWWTTSRELEQRQAGAAALEAQIAELRSTVEGAAAAPEAGTEDGVIDREQVAAQEALLAALEERLEAMDADLGSERQRVAALQEELATRGRGALRPGDVMIVEDLYQGVVRGEDGAPAAVDAAGHRLVVFQIALEGEVAQRTTVPYRIVDAAGSVLQRGELALRPARDAFSSPTLVIPVDLAALPEGELELQLLDGERVGRRLPIRR